MWLNVSFTLKNVAFRNVDELNIFPMEIMYVSKSPKLGHGWVHCPQRFASWILVRVYMDWDKRGQI